MKIPATLLNKNPGRFLDKARLEPIIIEKNTRPIAVLLAYETFLAMEPSVTINHHKKCSWPPGFFDFQPESAFPSAAKLRQGLTPPKANPFA